MTRVLITGGAGFIGHHIARRLSDAGAAIVSLDDLSPQVHLDPQMSRERLVGDLIEADILAEGALDEVGPVDAVVHLAAETGVGQSMYEVDRYRRVNVNGTAVVARWCGQRGTPLIFFSSRAVYGEGRYRCAIHASVADGSCCPEAQPVASREDDPPAPTSVYGQTKIEGEALLAAGGAGAAPVAVVRPQNVIGAGQALHNPYTGVLAAFLARLKEGRPILVYGDGSATRDFVHVSDVAALVEALVADPPQEGAPVVVNCGTGERTSLSELAHHSIAAAPVEGSIEYVEVHRAGDIEHACADLSRLASLGLPMPRVSTADAVADFIRSGWTAPDVASDIWDTALAELTDRGLAT